MKVRIYLAVLCLLTFHCFADGQTPKKNERTAEWEYKQLSSPSDEVINHHAKEGWEVTTALGGGGDSNSFYRVILKRHKSHALFGTPTSEIPKPQPPPQNPKCKLTLAEAPAIRGLRLGMTSDEIFSAFPGNEREEFERAQRLKSAEIAPDYGYATFQFDLYKYATKDRFTGISSIILGIFERKVVYIRADYSNIPPFDNMEQLMEIVSKQFGLPEYKDWPGYTNNFSNSSISCDGFTFRVEGYIRISLTDSSHTKILEERKRADLAKKREGFKL